MEQGNLNLMEFLSNFEISELRNNGDFLKILELLVLGLHEDLWFKFEEVNPIDKNGDKTSMVDVDNNEIVGKRYTFVIYEKDKLDINFSKFE